MMSVEGICLSGEKGLTLDEISRYINKTNEYARRCINVAIQLGMIRRVNYKYFAEAESEEIPKVKKEAWGKYANIVEMEENGTIKLKNLPEGKTAFHIKDLIESLSNELKNENLYRKQAYRCSF
jgi:hypothetical protein